MNAWLRDGPPLVVAHRGSSARAPENTLRAFRLAAEEGADAIEFDVRATADGALVVIHDAALERSTDGAGEIAALTLEAVRAADAGVRRGKAFAGERVPTLGEVLLLARGRLLVDIELKIAGIEARIAEAVRRAGMVEQTLVTSFLEEALAPARQAEPGMAMGLLQQWPDVSRAADLGVDVYLPAVRALSTEEMAFCRSRRLRVVPWTVRTEDDARAALSHGVDGLIADDPLLARRMIERG